MTGVQTCALPILPGHQLDAANRGGVELVSWYWHFVDGVWVVVFTMIYLIGR